MNHFYKAGPLVIGLMLNAISPALLAAPRDAGKADSGAVQKLQAMVKSLTTERDAAKTETAKLGTELEQLKKDAAKANSALQALESAKQQLDGELNAQKTSNTQVQDRLEKTNTRLLEVIDKYKELQKAKNDLANELQQTQNLKQVTEQQLNTCTEHNLKLYESGKDLLEHYQSKGTVSALLQDEPLLQFNSVEMESIMQDYEDKLRAGKLKTVTP